LIRVRISLILIIGALALLACDVSSYVALLDNSTPTPTRTPRPTFTPRPAFTPTPEDTPTPVPTDTPNATATPTKRPVVVATARPPTAKPPAPPPAPSFAWKQNPNTGNQGRCDAGPSVFEVKGRIHDGTDYAGGIHVVALDKNGNMVAQKDSLVREQMNLEWGVNCREEKNLFNYQLDISAGRGNGPITLRLTRSATDLTPISSDIKFDLDASGGRWYFDWSK
jgi:hypothetical protein